MVVKTKRALLCIPQTVRIRKDDILRRAGVGHDSSNQIKKRKIGYLAHILTRQKYVIPQLTLQSKIDGQKGIGRKQLS